MKKIIFCLSLCFGLFLSTAAYANSTPDISVKAEVDRAFMTIGDQINLQVIVTHVPKITVLDMDYKDALSDFDVKKVTDISSEDKGIVRNGKNFLMTNYTLGEYVIKPIKIQYRTEKGETKTISTNQLYVTVQSVDKNKKPDSDIKGVKSVISIKGHLLLWLTVITLLLSATGFIFWKLTHPKSLASGDKYESPLTPHDEAYKALAELEYSDLLKKGEVKLYFFRMSEIIRRYLERRFKIHTLECTTREILLESKDVIDLDNRKTIEEVLSLCDLVKFAKYIPQSLEIIQQNKQAKLLIDRTKEVPQALPVAGETKSVP